MIRFFVAVYWLSSLAQAADTDVFKMVSVSPVAGTTLASKPTKFRVKIRYTLGSVNRAVLTVYAERYRQAPQGCGPSQHHTEGGESVPVTKGTHEVEVIVTWVAESTLVPAGQGSFVGLGMNLWPFGGRGPVLRQFGVTSSCYVVAPGTE